MAPTSPERLAGATVPFPGFDNPCAQKYIDSQAQMFADWGYDFLKLDGVGPGSFKSGDNYNNVADVAAWHKAIAATGRPIHLELSWSLDIAHAAGEAVRQGVNDWIRNSGKFDAVTDFDKITRNPYDQQEIMPFFDGGDHLHPNDKGMQAMADAVDLSALRCDR